jgi:hypothetical protein
MEGPDHAKSLEAHSNLVRLQRGDPRERLLAEAQLAALLSLICAAAGAQERAA